MIRRPLCLLMLLLPATAALADVPPAPPGIDTRPGDPLSLAEVLAAAPKPQWPAAGAPGAATSPEVLAQADALLAAGRAFEAERLLQGAADAAGLARLGEAQARLQRREQAGATLRRAAALDAKLVLPRLQLAELTGDLGAAAEAWAAADAPVRARIARRMADLLTGHPLAQAEVLAQAGDPAAKRLAGDLWLAANRPREARAAWGAAADAVQLAWVLLAEGKGREAAAALLAAPDVQHGTERGLQLVKWFLAAAPQEASFATGLRGRLADLLGTPGGRRLQDATLAVWVQRRDASLLAAALAVDPQDAALAAALAESRLADPVRAAATLTWFASAQPLQLADLPAPSPALLAAVQAAQPDLGAALAARAAAQPAQPGLTLAALEKVPAGALPVDVVAADALARAGDGLGAKARLAPHLPAAQPVADLLAGRSRELRGPLADAQRQWLAAPADPRATESLMKAWADAGQYASAARFAAEHGLRTPWVRRLLADGRRAEALATSALPARPAPDDWGLRMEVLDAGSAEERAEADAMMRKLEKDLALDPAAQRVVGERLLRLGKHAEARKALARAAALGPLTPALEAAWKALPAAVEAGRP